MGVLTAKIGNGRRRTAWRKRTYDAHWRSLLCFGTVFIQRVTVYVCYIPLMSYSGTWLSFGVSGCMSIIVVSSHMFKMARAKI